MFSVLYTDNCEHRNGCEKENEKRESMPARLDGWILSSQQRRFLESLLEEKT